MLPLNDDTKPEIIGKIKLPVKIRLDDGWTEEKIKAFLEVANDDESKT